MTLDDEFVKMLACPSCRAPVRRDADRLVCEKCGLRYPIRDEIPIMLIEEAERPA